VVATAAAARSDDRKKRHRERGGGFRPAAPGNRPGMAEIAEQLTKYLTDAHSIEEQALAQLRTAPNLAGDDVLAAAYREHLQETEGHEHRIRTLLEAREAKPSLTKDTVMKVGGKGFLLFARLQPDTPGKLHAHALSYEALELSSYELLRGTAERAGEPLVARAADEIAAEERAMIERLEQGFDRAVEASLREVGDDDLDERLRKYLADAHAIEEQAVALLERGPKLAGSDRLATIYAEHLDETRDHAEAVEARLQALGGDPSSLKDAALRLGALNWGAFFQAHPDTAGKLAAFARAFEHLEIGGYEQLRRVAERAGDRETAQLAQRILAEEREAADRIAGAFDEAITAALEQQEITR
jgi:ferritin-like metal-binding protein YciE